MGDNANDMVAAAVTEASAEAGDGLARPGKSKKAGRGGRSVTVKFTTEEYDRVEALVDRLQGLNPYSRVGVAEAIRYAVDQAAGGVPVEGEPAPV